MIEKEELRIGNRVLLDGYDPFWKVCEIGQNLAAINYFQPRTAPYSQLSGIELTPELLEKVGFRKIDSYHKNEYQIATEHNHSYLTIEPESGNACFGHYESSCGCDGCFTAQFWIADIKYVHQLQNTFYCLTGKALEVKM